MPGTLAWLGKGLEARMGQDETLAETPGRRPAGAGRDPCTPAIPSPWHSPKGPVLRWLLGKTNPNVLLTGL